MFTALYGLEDMLYGVGAFREIPFPIREKPLCSQGIVCIFAT